MTDPRPPRWAGALLRGLVGEEYAASVLGDLAEGFRARVARGDGWWRARGWYWREVLSFARPASVYQLRCGGGRPRPERTGGFMVWHDLRFAWRSLRSTPGFALMAIATVTLGIAGTTTVFSAMDGIVLRPFPFPEPSRLVTVGSIHPKVGGELTFIEHLSPAEYLDIAGAKTVERVVAWDLGNRQVAVGETTENLFTGFWWGDAFKTVGLAPYLGRGFSNDEIDRGEQVAVLSHRVWEGRFGADSAIVGRKILVNGEPYVVVGIMPPKALVYGTDLWIPFPVRPEVFPRDRRMLQVMARLAPGATMNSFGAELDVIARRTEQSFGNAHPDYLGWRLVPKTWAEANVAQLATAAWAMVAAIVFVMLLVCTNVATLLLGRSTARIREMALRGALGASRGRLLRQLLTESMVLSLIGAAAGIGLGVLGIRGINAVLGSLSISIFSALTLNGAVVAATVLVAVVAGVAFGVIPALQVVGPDLRGSLHAGAALGGTRGRLRVQRWLIGLEAALALALLAGSGYLLRSLSAMQAVNPGFDPNGVLTFRMTLARERYRPEAVEPFFAEVRDRLAGVPGVRGVATTNQFPPNLYGRSEFAIEGIEAKAEGARPFAYTTIASTTYFSTLAIPLRRGRLFGPDDRADSPWSAVINEVVAARYFPSDDPIGKRIRVGGKDDPWATIVGVVGATSNRGLDLDPAPEVFISSAQVPGFNNQMFLLVKADGDPRAPLPAIRAAIAQLDPDQPIYAVRTIADAYRQTQIARRVSVGVFTIFGGFALAIAIIGLYGVVNYATAQRTREIGVRVALGAARSSVTGLFVRQAMAPVLAGTLVGLIAAWGVGRLLSSLLFQIRPGDVVTLLGAAAILLVAGLLASLVPAARATRLDPVVTLRQE